MIIRNRARLPAAFLLLLSVSASSLLAQPSLRITSPADGTVVTPGQSLRVTVEATPANAFKAVAIIATWEGGLSQPIFAPREFTIEFTIKVPENVRARKYALTAVGARPPEQGVYSNSIGLVLEGPDTPATLRVQPPILRLDAGGTAHLLVSGEFVCGQLLDLTRSTRIMYTMDNPGIITVGDQGIVTALAPGSTKLTITYGQAKTEVPAVVSAPRVR